jgi:putative ABC transport system ATP-binding protein
MPVRSLLIRIEGVSKIYKKGASPVRALQDINLTIREGEFLAIMGPSGSGKSTLLHVLGCLDRPSAGRYLFSGREISQLPDKELSLLRATKIGFIFQTYNLLPSFNVLGNIKIPFLYSPVKRPDEGQKAERALRDVGLGKRMFHYPAELSGGEMQRAAIARALVIDPLLLLADEPTGNLDSKTGQEVLELICRLHAKGRTVVMVTHNEEIARHAQRCLILRDGRIEA